MTLKVQTGAEGVLSVAHYAPDGRLHGHTYIVRAWWDNEPCAVESQERLKAWLGKFDHGCLPLNMSRAERIGEQCLMALGCCRVEVMRHGEGVFAQITYEKDITA